MKHYKDKKTILIITVSPISNYIANNFLIKSKISSKPGFVISRGNIYQQNVLFCII